MIGIIDDVIEKYLSLESYSDSGRTVSRLSSTNSKSASLQTFETAFRAPSDLFFAFHDMNALGERDKTYAIWTAPEGVRSWWSVSQDGTSDGYEAEESIDMAIAGATGISHGLASGVPALLTMRRSPRLTRLRDAVQAPDEIVDGVECVSLLQDDGLRRDQIWIGKSDLLIRRVLDEDRPGAMRQSYDERLKLGYVDADDLDLDPPAKDLASETVIDYKPAPNPTLTDDVFTFAPPKM